MDTIIGKWNQRFIKRINYLILFFILSTSFEVYSQRESDFKNYPFSYFDSIRFLVNDISKEHYTIKAYRLSETEKVNIDGKLDEPVWKRAEHGCCLLEKEPFPLVPMSQDTEFALLYDRENLYIGVWCFDGEPEKIVRQLAPRGTTAPDHLMIFIDSYHDHRTGYKFVVSPTGVQVDELRFDDIKRDGNWNGVWYSEGSVDENGWYAEVQIPFFNFRYPEQNTQTWGFNIMRSISKDASRGQWKPHLPEWDNTTRMSQMGNINGISGIQSGRKFEIRPYALAGRSHSQVHPAKNVTSFGGDIRYSPSSSLTLDFTVNPDFAQVDADVFEINLSRYPTRFQELRPFFTERINIFNTPLELFYSRRIGSNGDILGGIKMSGKLKHGVEFGLLGNLTGASLFSSAGHNIEEALFGVMRFKKEISNLGSIGLLTATKENQGQYNRIVGVDGSFLVTQSDIVDLQVATGMNEFDNDRNNAYLFSYMRTGDMLGFEFDFDRIDPDFEINRIGYIRKEYDRGWSRWAGSIRVSPRINKYRIRRVTANLKYQHTNDLFTSDYINQWLEKNPGLTPHQMFGYTEVSEKGSRTITSGVREKNNDRIGSDFSIQFMNEMSLTADWEYYGATELTGSYRGDFIEISYLTRPLSYGTKLAGAFSASDGTYYNFTEKYTGRQKGLSMDGEGRFFNRMSASLQGDYYETYNSVNERDGRYYKLSANSTWMFSKDLSIRLHAQGLFGSTWYGEKSSSNDYLVSCLLSWEYRPGSFFYLAYNENRYDEFNSIRSRDLELKNRTLLLKISYFFNV